MKSKRGKMVDMMKKKMKQKRQPIFFLIVKGALVPAPYSTGKTWINELQQSDKVFF
jgi:hypothetical protein